MVMIAPIPGLVSILWAKGIAFVALKDTCILGCYIALR